MNIYKPKLNTDSGWVGVDSGWVGVRQTQVGLEVIFIRVGIQDMN